MTIDAAAPDRAVKRTDLPFLRRRSKPVAAAHSKIADFVTGRATAHAGQPGARPGQPSARPGQPSARPGQPSAQPLNPSVGQRTAPVPPRTTPAARPPVPAEPRPAPAPPPTATSSLDLFAPQPVSPQPVSPQPVPPPAHPRAASGPPRSGSTSLDLGSPPPAPATTQSASPARVASSTSLDLGGPISLPPHAAPTRPSGSTSLDLAPAPPAAPSRVPAASTPRRAAPAFPEPRTQQGISTILTPFEPTVTLTRVQSGVGSLTFEAVVAAGVGDLRLGVAYQLRSGRSSTVQHHAGRRFAPPGETRRPIIMASRQQFERLALDLRQVTELERCVVYAFSGDGGRLRWGGTLVATTFGGDRIEMPIELPPSDAVAVLASVYNIHGQLVLRSEMDLIGRTVREACRGYGFDRITWLDEMSPVD